MVYLTQGQYDALSPAEKLAYDQQVAKCNTIPASTKIRYGLSTLGSVAGIVLAVHRKSGFWGGVGWFIVGSMAGGALGWLVTANMNEK